MGSDPTDESDIRNAALEAAAQICSQAGDNLVIGELPHGVCVALAAAIRALKSDPAPVPATKPFTFADPSAQREHDRHRAESEGRERE
ncbi:hypothetical protein [Rhizobium leguminosarum]|uniref:hypothetical protein n=1 Tax=Rhizobium leguminosarum TaxID=384 RepID=UPI0004829FB3|nr:hypothetical protein [Rhizobium leguminosarum]